MDVILPTIPHTGTNLVLRHILGGFTKVQNVKHTNNGGNNVIFTHIENSDNVRIFLNQFLGKHPIIIPLRHPLLVAVSWKVRQKPIEVLVSLWGFLIGFIDPHSPLYLCIDKSNRDSQLDNINDVLGLNLDTSWPVVSSVNRTAELAQTEIDLVGQMMNEHQHFFSKVGYD